MTHRRFGKSSTPSDAEWDTGSEPPVSLKAALTELDRHVRRNPDLEPLRQWTESILKVAFMPPGSPVPSLAPEDEQTEFLLERIREGWREGIPAVRVIAPALDRARLLGRVRAIDEIAGRDHAPTRGLRERLRVDPDPIVACIHDLLVTGEEPMRGLLEQHGLDAAYVFSIFRLTLLGELGEWSARICGHRSELGWTRCDCPVCGAAPALAESRGLEQQRFLRCLRCGAGWPGNRMQCPYCGTSDHRTLRYLFAEEDQNRCRLAICDACGGRLKIITTLAPLSAPGLVVAEFTMLYLDLVDPERDPEQA
jgi:Protein involved in formate dehydrogenase formation